MKLQHQNSREIGSIPGKMPCPNKRLDRFSAIFNGLNYESPIPGVAVFNLDNECFRGLQAVCALYLSKVLKRNEPIFDSSRLMDEFLLAKDSLINITPTGMILPKNYSILENNLIMSYFYKLIDLMGLGQRISHWQVPMHLRVKFPIAEESNLNRPRHAPEDRHIDSWSGYSNLGFTTLIPVFGDTEHNNVAFYRLKSESVSEDWFSYPKTKLEQKDIVQNYEKDPALVPFRQGTAVVFDASVLHATSRHGGCGMRFSIDNIFVPSKQFNVGFTEVIESSRVIEQMSHEQVKGVGRDFLFSFPDSDDQIKDSYGGSIDPTNFRVVSL